MHVVIGLGKTGISCVRWLRAQGVAVRVLDTRDNPPGLDAVRAEFPDVDIHVGGFRQDWLDAAMALVVSPGIAIAEPSIAAAAAKGVEIIGDIELFARFVSARQPRARVIGITGSNGKSTVTALVGEMVTAAGKRVAVGGNFGTPALDLIADGVDVYVLELSSFQLETTHTLHLASATVLNLSEDHMDRYASFDDYGWAKQRIFADCEVAVVNRDDVWSTPRGANTKQTISFGSDSSAEGFGIDTASGVRTITHDGMPLVSVDDLHIKGTHNQLNAMAALALGLGAELPVGAMVTALRAFAGLPHRCRFVGAKNGVAWYNDSKGTNIGATAAALAGLGDNIRGKVVLIAGGQGKGQDFTLLDPHVRTHVRNVVLIGEDAHVIRAALSEQAKLVDAGDMPDAVNRCAELAQSGDAVLLSPACASFDMYTGYDARGTHFEKLVRAKLGIAEVGA